MKTTREPRRILGEDDRTQVVYTHYYKGFAPYQPVTISDTSGGYYSKETLPANECGIVEVSYPTKYTVQDGVGDFWLDVYRHGSWDDYIGIAFPGNSPLTETKLNCANLGSKTLISDGDGGQFYHWRRGNNHVLYWSKLQPGVRAGIDISPPWELFHAEKKLRANACGVVKFTRKMSGKYVTVPGEKFWNGSNWLLNGGFSHDWLSMWQAEGTKDSSYICKNGVLYEPE